jgi:hypothetical protein
MIISTLVHQTIEFQHIYECSSYDICILIFIEGERIAGKKWEFFSLSGSLPSLFLSPSKWAPIPTLFRMITDRYNKNGNIRPLCARQLATGMNTRSGPQLPFFSSAPWTSHTVTRVTSHVKYAVTPFSLTLVQRTVLKYGAEVTRLLRIR